MQGKLPCKFPCSRHSCRQRDGMQEILLDTSLLWSGLLLGGAGRAALL